VVSLAVSATREVLKKRSDQRARSVSRVARMRARSPSCRGQVLDESSSDVAEACLEDIVRRADLLSQLQEALHRKLARRHKQRRRASSWAAG